MGGERLNLPQNAERMQKSREAAPAERTSANASLWNVRINTLARRRRWLVTFT